MRLAIALLVLCASAHAEPPRLAHDVTMPKLRIEHLPRHDHGVDEVLAIALSKVIHVASKVSKHGLIPYLHVDNLVSHESAPRTVVIGIQVRPIADSR